MNRARIGLGMAAFLALGLGAAAQSESSAPVIAQIAKQFDEHPLIMIGELHRFQTTSGSVRNLLPSNVTRVKKIPRRIFLSPAEKLIILAK